MRPKIIFALLLAGLAGFGGIFFLKNLTAPRQPATAPAVQPSIAPATAQEIKITAPGASQISPAAIKTPAAPAIPGIAGNDDDHEAYVQAHVDQLQELQTRDDAASFQAILSELTNSDRTIRAAAVESTIQFGNRDAIPVLKDLAARTGEPAEKKQLLDAADFLALPTLTEIRAQNPNVKIISPPIQP